MEIAEPVKRRVERVQFLQPLPARFGAAPVALSDLTLAGAGIQHQAQIPRGENHTLRFQWDGRDVSLDSRVVRTRLEFYRLGGASLTLYRSGLHFINVGEEESIILRKMITGKVARALNEQRANAFALSREEIETRIETTDEPKPAFSINELFTTSVHNRGFFRCTLTAGRWTRTWTDSPEQPEGGFTVNAAEGEDAVKLLCKTFEQADAPGRVLIRTIAQLSVSEPSDVPRDRFLP